LQDFHHDPNTMLLLIAGLVLFLGLHSLRVLGEGWRGRFIAQRGENTYKGLYSVVSAAGFGLLIWGYGVARQQPTVLWMPPVAMKHIAALLTLISFVMLAAAYVPGNAIKAKLKHPMMLATKVWALAHLLSNGTLADVLLFGGFLLWSVLAFRAARQRDRAEGKQYPAGTMAPTLITVVVGVAAWVVFALWLHGWLIGVKPFG
jgi:uncharacterized membrane protein